MLFTNIKRGDIMDKNELWRIFEKTGKIEDYLKYKNAD